VQYKGIRSLGLAAARSRSRPSDKSRVLVETARDADSLPTTTNP